MGKQVIVSIGTPAHSVRFEVPVNDEDARRVVKTLASTVELGLALLELKFHRVWSTQHAFQKDNDDE